MASGVRMTGVFFIVPNPRILNPPNHSIPAHRRKDLPGPVTHGKLAQEDPSENRRSITSTRLPHDPNKHRRRHLLMGRHSLIPFMRIY